MMRDEVRAKIVRRMHKVMSVLSTSFMAQSAITMLAAIDSAIFVSNFAPLQGVYLVLDAISLSTALYLFFTIVRKEKSRHTDDLRAAAKVSSDEKNERRISAARRKPLRPSIVASSLSPSLAERQSYSGDGNNARDDDDVSSAGKVGQYQNKFLLPPDPRRRHSHSEPSRNSSLHSRGSSLDSGKEVPFRTSIRLPSSIANGLSPSLSSHSSDGDTNSNTDDYPAYKVRQNNLLLSTDPRSRTGSNSHLEPSRNNDKKSAEALVCKICDQQFAQANDLTVHQQTHTTDDEDKPFRCKVCGERYAQSTSLLRHLRTHPESPISRQNAAAEANSPISSMDPGDSRNSSSADDDHHLEMQSLSIDKNMIVRIGGEKQMSE